MRGLRGTACSRPGHVVAIRWNTFRLRDAMVIAIELAIVTLPIVGEGLPLLFVLSSHPYRRQQSAMPGARDSHRLRNDHGRSWTIDVRVGCILAITIVAGIVPSILRGEQAKAFRYALRTHAEDSLCRNLVYRLADNGRHSLRRWERVRSSTGTRDSPRIRGGQGNFE